MLGWERTNSIPMFGKSRGSLVLALSLAVILALTAASAVACGEKRAEKAVEKAIEEAAKKQGEDIDVDVDVEDGSGSVKISGEQGEMQWQTGSDLELPEGFPASLLPAGAKVVTVSTSPGGKVVVFQTSDDPKKVFGHSLKAVTDLGYQVTTQLSSVSGQTTTIAIVGEKGDSQVMISGGDSSGRAFTYSITLVQGK